MYVVGVLMAQYSKLKLFSKVIWFATLLLALWRVGALVANYGFGIGHVEFNPNSNQHYSFTFSSTYSDMYQDLLTTDGVNLVALSFFPITIIFLTLFTLFWLQRLFGFYSKGHFFGDQVTRCYLVLIWARIFHFFFMTYNEQILIYFYPDRSDLVSVDININEFLLLAVLLVVSYVLKMANQIKKENQEFV